MIFFYCPECDEELEAEDSVKGSRMKCPACFKEIGVPEVGVPIGTAGRKSRTEVPPPRKGRSPLFWLAAVGLVLLFLAGGAFAISKFLRSRAPERPKCVFCAGTGKKVCHECQGGQSFPCKGECKGSGQVLHEASGTKSNCGDCGGTGKQPCKVCDGRGWYGCEKCGGTGSAVSVGTLGKGRLAPLCPS